MADKDKQMATSYSNWQERGRHWSARIMANELLLAICVVLAVIIIGAGFGWENNKLVPVNSDPHAHYLAEPHNRLSFLANWDGPDYLNIVRHGYQAKAQTNFFPLYPLLTRAVGAVVRSPLYAGLLVSWAGFVGAVYFYLRIFKHLYGLKDNLEALRGVLFFVLFPTGIFFIAAYTESLFACLALGAFYFALRKRYLPAVVLTAFSTATHANGIFIIALVALLMFEQREKLWKIAAGAVVGSLGLIGYMSFLLARFHNPLAFVASQKTNGWLNYNHHHLIAVLLTRKAIFLLLILIAVFYWWRRRRAFALYSLLYVCILFLGGLGGFGRYALMAFPVQIMAYDYLRHKQLAYALAIAGSSLFWMYFALQYLGGYSGG